MFAGRVTCTGELSEKDLGDGAGLTRGVSDGETRGAAKTGVCGADTETRGEAPRKDGVSCARATGAGCCTAGDVKRGEGVAGALRAVVSGRENWTCRLGAGAEKTRVAGGEAGAVPRLASALADRSPEYRPNPSLRASAALAKTMPAKRIKGFEVVVFMFASLPFAARKINLLR